MSNHAVARGEAIFLGGTAVLPKECILCGAAHDLARHTRTIHRHECPFWLCKEHSSEHGMAAAVSAISAAAAALGYQS
ncbi:MAG TPA: hypothetical protein VH575_25230 [Gemmataceae bacterium]|jgi:hypothetical protein